MSANLVDYSKLAFDLIDRLERFRTPDAPPAIRRAGCVTLVTLRPIRAVQDAPVVPNRFVARRAERVDEHTMDGRPCKVLGSR
jgi:hypothetical protein